jgi:hypothetical protein
VGRWDHFAYLYLVLTQRLDTLLPRAELRAAPVPCRGRQAIFDFTFGGPPRRADHAALDAQRASLSDRHQSLLELSAAKTYPGIRPGRNA